PQPHEDGDPHPPVARPFLERDFAYQFRLDPVDGGVRLGLPLERAGAPDQRLQSGSQVGEAARVEAAAGVADVDEVLPLEDAEHERAKVLAAAARLGEPADHRLLSPMGLDLEPGVTAGPFAV